MRCDVVTQCRKCSSCNHPTGCGREVEIEKTSGYGMVCGGGVSERGCSAAKHARTRSTRFVCAFALRQFPAISAWAAAKTGKSARTMISRRRISTLYLIVVDLFSFEPFSCLLTTANMTIKHNQQIQHNRKTCAIPDATSIHPSSSLLTPSQISARTGNAVSACTSTR